MKGKERKKKNRNELRDYKCLMRFTDASTFNLIKNNNNNSITYKIRGPDERECLQE